MPIWTETYRGTVPPWQCDITEHFTIAYYFDRLGEAERGIAEALGLREFLRGGRAPRTFEMRFARELRAGASFHIESAPISLEDGLRLGHRFVDSATGETVTWVIESWELPLGSLPLERQNAIAPWMVAWEGPAMEYRPEPKSMSDLNASARGRVKPADLSVDGRFSLEAIVHRFTDASLQTGAALGLDASFLEANRRGFSTFELVLRITGALDIDDPYLVQTGIAHLGNSSLRMVHRLSHQRTGAEIARLSQYGVNLDLDARRPAAWPAGTRERAAPLIVALEDG
jgi:acyl-CoA thioesterase FadM